VSLGRLDGLERGDGGPCAPVISAHAVGVGPSLPDRLTHRGRTLLGEHAGELDDARAPERLDELRLPAANGRRRFVVWRSKLLAGPLVRLAGPGSTLAHEALEITVFGHGRSGSPTARPQPGEVAAGVEPTELPWSVYRPSPWSRNRAGIGSSGSGAKSRLGRLLPRAGATASNLGQGATPVTPTMSDPYRERMFSKIAAAFSTAASSAAV
jgi:hypothetical protein